MLKIKHFIKNMGDLRGKMKYSGQGLSEDGSLKTQVEH